MKFRGVDLFCGAGGVTTGIEKARYNRHKIAEVVACVNHDPVAIASHSANHKKTIHYIEDIKNFDVKRFPKLKQDGDITYLWASLECTNFSNAKGGLPRDADSRTLANHLFRYIEHLNPDYILIENVREFMSWGDLDKNGKPVSKDRGKHFVKWLNKVKSFGYEYSHQILNSADFGAYTSRKRLFIIFAKVGMPIVFPAATHCKDGNEMLGLKKWNAVKEVLDFDDKGESIFQRKKPLSDKTFKRIYAGLIKYVANGEKAFLTKYFSGHPESKNSSVMNPSGTITTIDHHALVQSTFLTKYHGNGENVLSTNDCCSTLSTKDRLALIQTESFDCVFMDQQFGQSKPKSIEEPSNALTANPKYNLVTAEGWLMDTNFNNTGNSVNDPSPVITASRHQHYLMNPQYFSAGGSIDNPCFTLIAKMDKKPPYLVTAENGTPAIEVYETDSEDVRKVKQFMAAYGIVDIKMRMLRIKELLKIQGFDERYVLKGSQTDKKKFIGNAVVPVIPQKMIETLYKAQLEERIISKAS